MPVLLVRDEDETKRFEYERGKDILIGRAEDNDLSFPKDFKLSKKHCQLCFFEEKDCYYITDLNSTNGTWLNQNRISTDIILSDNDKIQIGNIRILFKYDSFDSPTKTRKILKLIKKPKNGLFEQTDTLRLPNVALATQEAHAAVIDEGIIKLNPGDKIHDYQITTHMIETRHGSIYQAIHTKTKQYAAIKLFVMSFGLTHPGIDEFNNTFSRLMHIDNPYYVKISDFGLHNGHCFYVMDYIESQNLNLKIAQSAPFPEYDALCIIYTVAAALQSAFEHYKIIHGDLSPANIFIDSENNLIITGLGTAGWLKKYFSKGKSLVAADYASPEEALGKELDWRIDQYSLGIIFFQLLTGYLPFQGNTDDEIYNLHLNFELPHPQTLNPNIWVSEDSLQVLRRSTAKEPEDRYESWKELLEAIAQSYNQFETPMEPKEEKTSTESLSKIFDTYYDQKNE